MKESKQKEMLSWLEKRDGYYIGTDVLEEEWPSFPEDKLVGVTMTLNDDGTPQVPKRDIRDVLKYGVPLD